MAWPAKRNGYARDVTINGVTYPSIRQAALAHGFNPEAIVHRLRRMTVEQAFSQPLRHTDPGGRRKKRAARAAAVREALRRYKAARPCADCGGSFHPEAMDFDHARGQKRFEISAIGGDISIRALKAEIAKCDLVCANCHRLRTHQRRTGKL